MARKIEQALKDAVRTNTPWKGGNTVWDPASQTVTLWGSVIARNLAGGWQFNLAGFNTPTTRSRLNALGAGVSNKAGMPIVAGKPVPLSGWFNANGYVYETRQAA